MKNIESLGKLEDVFFVPNGKDHENIKEMVIRVEGQYYLWECLGKDTQKLEKIN